MSEIKKNQYENVWTRPAVVFLTALFCCTLWGSAASCIKNGYILFYIQNSSSRILFAGTRFTLAGIMVVLAGSLLRHSWLLPKRGSWKYIALLALTQTVLQYVATYLAIAWISGVRSAILNATGTFFSIFMAVFLFRFEKLTFRKVIGSVIGFAGVCMIITGGSLASVGAGFSWKGDGVYLIATASSALAGCLIKLFSRREDPVMLSGWQFICGGLFMVFIGAAGGGTMTFTSAACVPLILYLGFISAGAYTFWGILLKYNPVSRVSTLGFINPVMGVLLSAIFLNEGREAFHLITLAALLLVSLGIFIVNYEGSGGTDTRPENRAHPKKDGNCNV